MKNFVYFCLFIIFWQHIPLKGKSLSFVYYNFDYSWFVYYSFQNTTGKRKILYIFLFIIFDHAHGTPLKGKSLSLFIIIFAIFGLFIIFLQNTPGKPKTLYICLSINKVFWCKVVLWCIFCFFRFCPLQYLFMVLLT